MRFRPRTVLLWGSCPLSVAGAFAITLGSDRRCEGSRIQLWESQYTLETAVRNGEKNFIFTQMASHEDSALDSLVERNQVKDLFPNLQRHMERGDSSKGRVCTVSNKPKHYARKINHL